MSQLSIPSNPDIQTAHEKLIECQRSGGSLSMEQWVLFANWARFDPQLAEIWVRTMSESWRGLPPFLLREANLRYKEPATLGLLLEHVRILVSDALENEIYGFWKRAVCAGVPPARGEAFFIGVRDFASKGTREDAESSLEIYLKWGFFGRDVLVNKFLKMQESAPKTFLSPDKRKRILRRLLKGRKQVRCEDYIGACNGAISRRMAQMDLARFPKIKITGNTRNRRYSLLAR